MQNSRRTILNNANISGWKTGARCAVNNEMQNNLYNKERKRREQSEKLKIHEPPTCFSFFRCLCSFFLSASVYCFSNLFVTDLCLCFQVSQDGKALLDVLQRPLSPGNSDSLTASANYSKAVSAIDFTCVVRAFSAGQLQKSFTFCKLNKKM